MKNGLLVHFWRDRLQGVQLTLSLVRTNICLQQADCFTSKSLTPVLLHRAPSYTEQFLLDLFIRSERDPVYVEITRAKILSNGLCDSLHCFNYHLSCS